MVNNNNQEEKEENVNYSDHLKKIEASEKNRIN